MNVEEFVSESLRQIGAGVVRAAACPGINVSPRPHGGPETSATVGHLRADGKLIVLVEFDLSVSVQSKLEGTAGGGLTVLGIGGKADVSGGLDQTRVQRLKFQIPVTLNPKANAETA